MSFNDQKSAKCLKSKQTKSCKPRMSSVEPLNVCQLISLIEEPTRSLSQTEIVWSVVGCLSGAESVCFGWRQSDQHFHVKHGLTADKYLNQKVLFNYLNFFCKYGTAFKVMFDFCYNEVKDEEHIICHTFNAFRTSLRYILIDYIWHLNAITDHLVNNNKESKSISLLGFKYWLDSNQNQNLLLRIEILWQIFEQIRDIAVTKNTNSSLSFAILNSLYERIDFQKTSIKNIIYKLFIDCLKPTLDYFDYILSNGLIRDPHQEFVFIESYEDINSANFWRNCLKTVDDLDGIPDFLAKLLDTILIASKSRLMSQRLGFDDKTSINKSINLFYNFYSILNEMLKKSDFSDQSKETEVTKKIAQTDQNNVMYAVLPKSLTLDPSEKTEFDSDINYFDVYSMQNSKHYYDYNVNFELKDQSFFSELYLPPKSIKTVEMMINEALTEIIEKTCSCISSELIDLIIDEYKQYFNNFCDFYLLRSSNVIPIYCSELFQNLNAINSSKLDNLYALENESVFESIPFIKPFISCNDLSLEPLKFFKNIYLIYDPIEWPFVVLFNDEVVTLFNKVFQLLLKVKYSKWILDQLMFTTQFKRGLSNKQIFVMRFKLQNSVNKLYNYLMNEINVHINETIDRFDSLSNFEQLLAIHNNFVVRLKQTIFYRQKTLRNIVKKLIDLCSQLQELWTSDDQTTDQSVDNIDLDIDRCNHLLDSFYEVLLKR